MRHFLLILLPLFFLAPAEGDAQATLLSDNAQISVLTCASGDQLYSLFGHTAIRVSDSANGIDVVYNFGAFDFSTPNFYLKFIKGDLQYFVTTASYGEFLYEYQYLGRSVYEQPLNLNHQQKQLVNDRLTSILGSDERFYTYKFVDRNCTTMVVDIIEKAIGKPVSLDIEGKGKTNRDILYGYIQSQFYANLGISIMFGAKTDRELYKVYLPMQFLESINKTTVGNRPLTNGVITAYEAPASGRTASWWDNPYTYGFLLLLLAFNRNRTIMLSWLMLSGLLGIFLSVVGLYSYHQELLWNYNALLFSPLFIGLVIAVLKKKKSARIWWFASAGCLSVYLAYMLNKPHLLLMLPILFVNGIYLYRIYAKLLPTVK